MNRSVCCVSLFLKYSKKKQTQELKVNNGQKVNMTRNYHNHIQQINAWHREEESKEKSTNNNSDMTFRTQQN